MSDRVAWGEGAYAGFWQRFAGRLIDWIVVGAVTFVLAMVLAVVFGIVAVTQGQAGTVLTGETEAGLLVALWIALLLPDFLYDTLMTSRLGWTVGKRAVGVEVRRQDGTLLSFGQAAGRWFGRIVSSIPLNLGFLWAAWDARKQTWHDKFVRCYVLKREYLTVPASAPTQPAARPWGGQAGWGIPGAAHPGAQPSGAAAAPVGTGWPEVDPGGAEPRPAVSPPPGAEPAGKDEPTGGTDWAHELGWDVDEAAAGPALEGDSLESARWAESPPATAGAGPAPGGEPEADGGRAASSSEPEAHEPEAHAPEAREPEAREPDGHAPAGDVPRQPPTPSQETGPARTASTDPNVVAIGRAAIPAESAGWLQQVADQVDSRLDRVASGWRSSPQFDAARACAFGLLLGHLAAIYPHMEDDLDRVAEAHPSFSTLGTGGRLTTLQQIAADHARSTAWLGPLIGTNDREQVRRLFE